jgi:hypothetical protein
MKGRLLVVSPGGFMIYSGDDFSDWKGGGFLAGLSSEALVRIEFDGENAGGRLLKLTPR